MTRTMLLAITASTAVAGTTYFYGQGTAVQLQPTTPGTQQVGNANVSGRVIAGSIQAENSAPTAQVIVGNATAATGANFGGFFRSDSVMGRALYGRASASSGTTHGVWGQSDSPAGRGVTGVAPATTGNATGVWGQTASTTGRGVYGFTTSTNGVNYGVLGQTSSPAGFGVFSIGNMHATGVISGNGAGLTNVNAAQLGGFAASEYLKEVLAPLTLLYSGPSSVIRGENLGTISGATGIYGVSRALTTTTYGVLGESHSQIGRGVFGLATAANGVSSGVYGRSASTGGRGVFGIASATTGPTNGVYGESQSTTGSGVYGDASATTGITTGVNGRTSSVAGRGVFAYATATSGFTHGVRAQVDSPDGRALLGFASNGAGTSYGVRGQSDSPTGWGVYSVGRFGSTGTKSFRIDHPLDPENKYLLHYAAESPTPQNFYVGNVVTDAQGYAWVTLPDYFSEINKNFKYQLTVVDGQNTDDFVMAKVATKIKDGRFLIRTNAPNTEVSWRVDADRNDLYVRNRPTKAVEDKGEFERGRYQHPEFYGLGFERGMEKDERQLQQQAPPIAARKR